MTAVDTIVRTLNERFADSTRIVTPRANEVHCELSPVSINRLADLVCRDLDAGLIAIAGDDRRREARVFFVHYVFANRTENWFVHASVRLNGGQPELPTMAPSSYPASRFERELRDLFGIDVVGHPDPRPLVKHAFWPEDYYPLRKDASAPSFADDGRPFPFTPVGGEGVYEIPVGPVHAGVIEPGHFRFSVMGETIIDMKSRLYFTHKGTEKLFEERDPMAGLELAERVSGDTTVGHGLAYCQAIEAAAQAQAPLRARLLRVVLLELERLYNHIADFGAIANDTGFAIAHAHCFRIRERLLRLNKQLTGSRLLRGVLAPGGLARDLDVPADLAGGIDAALADFEEIVAICLANTLVADRLDGTGVLSTELAREYGALGPVARASGVDIDARRDHPSAAYDQLRFAVPVQTAGDVGARVRVRIDEARESASLVRQACHGLAGLKGSPIRIELGRIDPFAAAFGIVEGWRGRIVHWVMADHRGALHRVKIVDPSFFNWPALSRALTGTIVPDFPLCNKSFNQSYSGNDL